MIRFSKYIWIYFFISALVLVPGIYALIRFGLRPSIDFTGGTLVELQTTMSQDALEKSAQRANLDLIGVAQSKDGIYVIRLRERSDAQIDQFTQGSVVLRRETVGPILGRELLAKAVAAALLAIAVILAYVAYAFRNIKFGVSAVIALLHDLLVVLGVFALLGHFAHIEVDTLFVTAVLTTMSFSVHDTIVVFDRIREYRKRDAITPLPRIADRALMETMNRSLINSLTIVFMLLALLLMGGETTKWFVAALLVGTVSGTYSSPFIATPILILWDRWEHR